MTDQSLCTVVGVQLDVTPNVVLPYPVHCEKVQLVFGPLASTPLSKSKESPAVTNRVSSARPSPSVSVLLV